MLQNILLSIFLCSMMSTAVASSAPLITKKSCASVSNKISSINSQMRSGYSVQQGERLRNKERDLKNIRDKCKKKKYPTSR
jgi:hypothetical protein